MNCLGGDPLSPVAVRCWLAATSIAEWYDGIDPSTLRFILRLSADWRFPVPADLETMPALLFAETWRVLEDEYGLNDIKNAKTEALLDARKSISKRWALFC